MNLFCLDLNNKEVREWIENVGLEETYKQTILHNYNLPDFSEYKKVSESPLLETKEIKALYDSILDPTKYGFKELSELSNKSVETQAAFWNNVFYFDKKVSLGQMHEEAFHAIFQTLTSPEERNELLKVGKALLNERLKKAGKKLNNHLKEQSEIISLTGDDLYNYLAEEELAKEWVNGNLYSKLNDPQKTLKRDLKEFFGDGFISKVIDIVSNFFNKLISTLGLHRDNRELLAKYFADIKDGKYRDKQVYQENGYTFPSLSPMILEDKDRNTSIYNPYLVQLHLGTALGIYNQIKDTFIYKENEEGEKVFVTREDQLNEAIEIFKEATLGNDPQEATANFIESLNPQENLMYGIDENEAPYFLTQNFISFKEELEKLISSTKLEQIDLEEQDWDDLDESVRSFYESVSDKANQVDYFRKFSQLAKSYISTIPYKYLGEIEKKFYDLNGNSETYKIKVQQLIDPYRVYSSVIKLTSNDNSPLNKIQKLIAYIQEEEQDTQTGAFIKRFLLDTFKVEEEFYSSLVDHIMSLKHDEQLQEKGQSYVIKNITLFKSLTSAFNLFERPYRLYFFDKNGKGNTYASNPAYVNVDKIQIGEWQTVWEADKWNLNEKNNTVTNRDFIPDLEGWNSSNNREKYLDTKIDRMTNFLNTFGITLSKSYIKYIFAEHLYSNGFPEVPEDLFAIYESQYLKKSEMLSLGELHSFVSMIGKVNSSATEESELFDPYSKDKEKDALGKIKQLARGNAYFNETIPLGTHLNADNKSIYGYQQQTHFLNLMNHVFRSEELFDAYLDATEHINSEAGNPFVEFYNNVSKKGKHLLLPFSYGGVTVESVGDTTAKSDIKKSTVDEITPEQVEVMKINAIQHDVRKDGQNILVPYHIGNAETSKTISFFTGKWYAKNETYEVQEAGRKVKIEANNIILPSGSLSKEGVEIYKKFIDSEWSRIEKEFEYLSDFINTKKDGTEQVISISEDKLRELPKYKEDDIYAGYHTGKLYLNADGSINNKTFNDAKGVRSLKFSAGLAGISEDLIQAYLNNESEEDKIKILQFNLNGLLDRHIKEIPKAFITAKKADILSNVWYKRLDSASENINDKAAFNVQKTLGLYRMHTESKNRELNLKLFYFNDLVNRTGFNRVMFGDEAKNNKSESEDFLKRFKAIESAIASVATKIINPQAGIFKVLDKLRLVQYVEGDSFDDSLSGVTGGRINQDDAQSLITVEHLRYLLHGLGKLDKKTVALLDKITEGIPFTDEENDQMETFFNVLKTRGYGKNLDLKTSMFHLTKTFTSREVSITKEEYDNNGEVVNTNEFNSYYTIPREDAKSEVTKRFIDGEMKYFKWVAKPGMEYLHSKRMLMEGWRQENKQWIFKGEESKIDVMSPISAHKRAKKNIWNLDDSNLEDYHVQSFDILTDNLYGLQVENPGGHVTIKDPTQQLEIMLSEVGSDIVIYDYKGNKLATLDKEHVTTTFQNLLKNRDVNAFNMALTEVIGSEGQPYYKYIFSRIQESLMGTGGDTQMINFTQLDKLTNEPKYNLNLPITKNKFEQMLFAHFSKGVLSQARGGDAKAMISPKGIGLLKKLEKHTIAGETVYSWKTIQSHTQEYLDNVDNVLDANNFNMKGKTFNGKEERGNLNTLQEEFDRMSEQGDIYFIDELRHLKPRVINGEITGYFSEAMMPIYHSKQKDIQDSFRYMNGVRIPSQDKATSANIEWVETMDYYYGNSVIAAKEIQELAGSDFDIDKLFVSYYEGYWEGDEFKTYENNYNDYLKYMFSSNKSVKNLYSEKIKESKELATTKENIKNLQEARKNFSKDILEQYKEAYKPQVKQAIDLIYAIEKEIQESKVISAKTFAELSEIQGELPTAIKEQQSLIKDLYEKLKTSTNKDVDFEEIQNERFVLRDLYYNFNKDKPLGKIKGLMNSLSLDKELRDSRRKEIKGLEKQIEDFAEQNKELLDYVKPYLELGQELRKAYDYKNGIELALQKETMEERGLFLDNSEYNPELAYNGFINNALLDHQIAYLTHNYAAYSRPTDVKKLKGLGASGNNEFGLFTDTDFEDTSKLPYNSSLYQYYYFLKTKAAKTGISSAVNANLAGLFLNRLKVRLNPGMELAYKHSSGESFVFDSFTEKIKLLDGKEDDVLAWISRLITATTDEAKEGVLAKFNLIGKTLDAFASALLIGMHPEVSIKLLNSKIIKTINAQGQRNPLFIGKAPLIEEIVAQTLSTLKKGLAEQVDETLTDKILKEEEGMLGDYVILTNFQKLLNIANQNSDVVKFIRIKRGFDPSYVDFVKILQAGLNLNIDSIFPFYARHDIKQYKDYSKEGIAYDLPRYLVENPDAVAQVVNYMKDVVPAMHNVLGKFLLEGNKNYISVYSYLDSNTQKEDYEIEDFKKEVNSFIMGYIASNIKKYNLDGKLIFSTEDSSTLVERFDKIIKDNKENPEIKESILFKKLSADRSGSKIKRKKDSNKGKNITAEDKTDTFTLNTFGKLSPEVQSLLMDEYARLMLHPDKEISSFVNDLFSYFLIKDGLNYTPSGISKIFPNFKFLDISQGIDNFLAGKNPDGSLLNVEWVKRLAERKILTDIRNHKYVKTFPLKAGEDFIFYRNGTANVGTEDNTVKLSGVVSLKKKPNIIKELLSQGVVTENEYGQIVYPHVIKLANADKYIYWKIAENGSTVSYGLAPRVGSYNTYSQMMDDVIIYSGEKLANIKKLVTEALSEIKNNEKISETYRRDLLNTVQKHLEKLDRLELDKVVEDEFSDYEIIAEDENQPIEVRDELQQDSVREQSNSNGEEISSYANNLAFALTNPTHTSPKGKDWNRNWTKEQESWRNYLSKGITYNGIKYKDVEEAYQKNKKNFVIEKDLFNQDAKTTFDLMVDLITIKLNTYPKLIEGINAKGGLLYLENSTHQPTKENTFWESKGGNGFIKALVQAYKNIKEDQSTNTSSLASNDLSLPDTLQNTGDLSVTNQVKPGVKELFKSNPELANKVAFKKIDNAKGINYQNTQSVSDQGIIASEKTIRDLAARMSDRIGIEVKFESDRTKEYKGKIENNVAYVNLAYADLSSPIHEILGHPIIRAIKNKNWNKEYDEKGMYVKNSDNQLYPNLLKELETGRGAEVLDRIKRDYDIKTDPNEVNKEDYEIKHSLVIDRNGRYKISHKTNKYNNKFPGLYATREEAEIAFQRLFPKKVINRYTLEEQQEEAIVELLSLMTAEKLDNVKDGKLISLLKRLLKEMKQFVRSLINQKEVEIDKLPDNMTLGDLADLLAYSNSKLILPGYEVEYTTPDNMKFKTYQEASNHISELTKNNEDVDLSDVSVNLEQNKNRYSVFKWNFGKPELIEKELTKEEAENKAKELGKDYIVDFSKDITGKQNLIKDFVEKNKEYEQSKEIIEEWKKVNNIQYNPEEIYSRGQEFSSVVGAYSSFDVNLMMQNLLQHIEDNEKAGGKFAISAYTKPVDKQIGHLEGGGGKIKFKLYPQSNDILWAANTDVYSGSVWDASDKINKDKKSELLGVSYTKYPSLSNVNAVQPSLASIIDDLAHHHNELGIVLTGSNFRLEYDDNIPYQTKKIIDSINSILDQKYGKLIKPEIKTPKKLTIQEKDELQNLKNLQTEALKTALPDFLSFEDLFSKKDQDRINELQKTEGIQPTQTNNNLKESIDSVKSKLETKDDIYGLKLTYNNGYYFNAFINRDSKNATEIWLADKIDNQPKHKTVEEAGEWEKEFLNEFKTKFKKEYTSQALINTKIAALKEVAKKYPRSLIRSEVVLSNKIARANRNLGFEGDELPFQKIGSKQDIENFKNFTEDNNNSWKSTENDSNFVQETTPDMLNFDKSCY